MYDELHKHKWMRDNGDGTYTMWMVAYQPNMAESWFCGGGTFSLGDYPDDEREHAMRCHGLDYTDERPSDYEVAQCVFECNWADFDLESFFTEAEAVAWVTGQMEVAK